MPLPPEATDNDGRVDVEAVADRLGLGVVRSTAPDGNQELIALGPATMGGRALSTAEAPELVLPDFDGNPFRLSSLRGTKAVLVAVGALLRLRP